MSTAIIKFEDNDLLVYCKRDSYPAGIGFDLVKYIDSLRKKDSIKEFFCNERFEFVSEVPKDIQYEYIIQKDGNVHCQECWFTSDKSYHGGGFRHGGTYDLRELIEKIDLQNKYAYRRPEAWQDK